MKKLIIALLLSLCLAMGGIDGALAADYVTPKPLAGFTYLSEAYDKSGNCLVFIDDTGDLVCDFAMIFYLKTGNDGLKMLIPVTELTCEQAGVAVEAVRKQMELADEQPMIWDNDHGVLVYDTNRHI
jgi:hypothetical protein